MTKEVEENYEKTLTALSAEYEFTNKNPSGVVDVLASRSDYSNVKEKFRYSPQQYDYLDANGKGYSFIHHEPLKFINDEAFANHTFVGLNQHGDMSDMAVTENVDVLNLVLFTTLKAPNGKYLKNVNGNLFAITEPDEILTDANMFKIYRSFYSGKGYDINNPENLSYVISQGQKFATVKMFMNRFNIEMKDLINEDPIGIQHYKIYQIPGTNRITIYSMMENPWKASVSPLSNGNQSVDPKAVARIESTLTEVHRFWSIYDGLSSDLNPNKNGRYPTHIYESSAGWPNMVKLNGNIFNAKYISKELCPCNCAIGGENKDTYCSTNHDSSDYNVKSVDTLERIGNNYLFEAGYLADGNDRYITIGFDGKIRWVKYFNEFYDKFFNSSVTPDKIIEDIKPSIVYECPYKAVMDKDGFKLNFVELKNVMTPGYDYTAFDKPLLK